MTGVTPEVPDEPLDPELPEDPDVPLDPDEPLDPEVPDEPLLILCDQTKLPSLSTVRR
jgi:hypothetical protein